MAYGSNSNNNNNNSNNRNRKIYSRNDLRGSNKAAIALEYQRTEKAPKVIATGKGYLADKIIQKQKKRTFLYIRMKSLQMTYQNWI